MNALLSIRRPILVSVVFLVPPVAPAGTLPELNEALLERIQLVHGITDAQVDSLRAIFKRSGYVGQGNPKVTVHPATEAECAEKLRGLGTEYQNPLFLDICGKPFMAPLYDPETQDIGEARVCIDQFEFPNIPCVYPVVWVRANEAAKICEVLGKRLCDAHEWEGACEGSLKPPDYRFDLARGKPANEAVQAMRAAHNQRFAGAKKWGYGGEYQKRICGTSGSKSPSCDGGGWSLCGSNTFPAGFFPDCTSALRVFDLHGNAAEHMNLPLAPDQMASDKSRAYGVTEMKGSWFVFDAFRAHEDWCRWRAPFWHGTRVMDPKSHHNYHLSFRCCDDVAANEGH